MPINFNADDVWREAERYQDGVAKLVHCAQTVEGRDGIRLAWEDEQIAEWLNRQVDLDGAGELKIDSPIGVAGYRVDARLPGDDWHSLVAVESVGDLMLGPISLGAFEGEAVLEVNPAQLSPKRPGEFWFPSYFATWRGTSLALTDPNLVAMHARADVQDPDTPPHLLDREKNFVPVDTGISLQYGNTYEFRVRMADLTRGGPGDAAPSPEPPRFSVASVKFRRRKPPGPVELAKQPFAESRTVRVGKPRLGYPEILYTGASFAALDADLDTLSADRTIQREIGLPDPDVRELRILVEARALAGDEAPWLPLYETTRKFDADEIAIDIDPQDHPTLATLAANQPGAGALALPTARDLRLTFTALGRDDADYFDAPEHRVGAPVKLELRAAAGAEADLLADPAGWPALRSFFFQPPPADGSQPSPVERLGAELKLDPNGADPRRPGGWAHGAGLFLRAAPHTVAGRGRVDDLLCRGSCTALDQRRRVHDAARLDVGRTGSRWHRRHASRAFEKRRYDGAGRSRSSCRARSRRSRSRRALWIRARSRGSRPGWFSSTRSIPSRSRQNFRARSRSTTCCSRSFATCRRPRPTTRSILLPVVTPPRADAAPGLGGAGVLAVRARGRLLIDESADEVAVVRVRAGAG